MSRVLPFCVTPTLWGHGCPIHSHTVSIKGNTMLSLHGSMQDGRGCALACTSHQETSHGVICFLASSFVRVLCWHPHDLSQIFSCPCLHPSSPCSMVSIVQNSPSITQSYEAVLNFPIPSLYLCGVGNLSSIPWFVPSIHPHAQPPPTDGRTNANTSLPVLKCTCR